MVAIAFCYRNAEIIALLRRSFANSRQTTDATTRGGGGAAVCTTIAKQDNVNFTQATCGGGEVVGNNHLSSLQQPPLLTSPGQPPSSTVLEYQEVSRADLRINETQCWWLVFYFVVITKTNPPLLHTLLRTLLIPLCVPAHFCYLTREDAQFATTNLDSFQRSILSEQWFCFPC